MPTWLPTPSQHFLFTAVALLVYVLGSRSRQERRAPAAAIAWVMGLVLLPYLMLPLYLMFGQRKLRATRVPGAPAIAANQPWAAALLQSFGFALPGLAQVKLHQDGARSREALLDLIDSARERLDVCTFLLGNDAFGRDILERLTRQARSGVQVRLLLDGIGALLVPRQGLKTLKEAGGQVAVFRPLFSVRRSGPRNLRNHRKYTIADDARLWAGGRNLAAEYFTGRDGAEPWIDLSFELTGEIAATVAGQFETDWRAARGQPRAGLPVATRSNYGALTQFLPSGPDQTEDTAQALLIDSCFRAQQRLLAVTPYFVPDESLRSALRLAARRGVQITIVMPATSNHRLADFVRHRALRDLAQAGVTFRLLPQMVHAKAVVVDDILALCGSVNLDLRSLLLNYESAVVFYGMEEIVWLTQWMERQAAKGKSYAPATPGFWRDVAEGLLLTVAFQL